MLHSTVICFVVFRYTYYEKDQSLQLSIIHFQLAVTIIATCHTVFEQLNLNTLFIEGRYSLATSYKLAEILRGI